MTVPKVPTRITSSNLFEFSPGGAATTVTVLFPASQDLINAGSDRCKRSADFNYHSKSDYSWAVLNNGVYTTKEHDSNVDPRLRFGPILL